MVWKASKDPLLRGDHAGGVTPPAPSADNSLVRHILFLGGSGRETPYQSSTESQSVAERFAGKQGCVYETSVKEAKKQGVVHWSRKELLDLLKGRGKGKASWPSAYEVMQARKRVEQHSEHLLGFEQVTVEDVVRVCSTVWNKR